MIAIRAPPHVELTVGFNGVNASLARLSGCVEIRSQSQSQIYAAHAHALALSMVTLQLLCIETVAIPASGIRSKVGSKVNSSTCTPVSKSYTLWQAGRSLNYEEIISMDIPFVLPLPKDSEASKSLSPTYNHPRRSTRYELVATAHIANTIVQSSSAGLRQETSVIEVIIENFRTLPTWGQFHSPQVINKQSPDHLCEAQITLARTSYGPRDTMTVGFLIRGNQDWSAKSSKVRVKEIGLALVRIISYTNHTNEGSTATSAAGSSPNTGLVVEKKVIEQRFEMGMSKLPEPGLSKSLTLTIPDRQQTVGLHTPLSYSSIGFTAENRLYSTHFALYVKISLSRAESIVVDGIPITISPYSLEAAREIESSIETSVLETRSDPCARISGVYERELRIRKSASSNVDPNSNSGITFPKPDDSSSSKRLVID